jgi:LysM repeat protein
MKRYCIFLSLLLTLILFFPKGVEAHPRQVYLNLTAEDVIAGVNSLRALNNLPTYQINSVLMVIAQSQAEYMASTGVITHFGTDGSRPYQRAISAGYPVAGDLTFGGFFSENIHAGANLSAAEVVDIWKADADHLKTMISPDLKDIGVGVAVENGITYYVLDAGTSTGSTSEIQTPSSLVVASASVPGTLGTGTAFVITSTPLEDGTVYHIVQPEEALWSIALAYNLTIDELKRMNQLSSNNIFIGQKLLISKHEVSTATLEPTITVTLGISTSTATHPVTPTTTFTPTPLPAPPASGQSGRMVVSAIVIVALLAAGLGVWLSRKKPNT